MAILLVRDGETDSTALRIRQRADVPLNQRGVNVWSIPAGKMRRPHRVPLCRDNRSRSYGTNVSR